MKFQTAMSEQSLIFYKRNKT